MNLVKFYILFSLYSQTTNPFSEVKRDTEQMQDDQFDDTEVLWLFLFLIVRYAYDYSSFCIAAKYYLFRSFVTFCLKAYYTYKNVHHECIWKP